MIDQTLDLINCLRVTDEVWYWVRTAKFKNQNFDYTRIIATVHFLNGVNQVSASYATAFYIVIRRQFLKHGHWMLMSDTCSLLHAAQFVKHGRVVSWFVVPLRMHYAFTLMNSLCQMLKPSSRARLQTFLREIFDRRKHSQTLCQACWSIGHRFKKRFCALRRSVNTGQRPAHDILRSPI